MSLVHLEEKIAALDDTELRKLQTFIASLRQQRDPEWQAELERKPERPRMTRELAEARAVGGGKGTFDSVAFLRTLK